jgi:hypothetical protein
MMLKIVLPFAMVWAAMAQAPMVAPIRTGDIARQLTKQDVDAVKAVLPSGGNPWLLNGDPGLDSNIYYIEAYLTPTAETAAVRRGPLVRAMRQIKPPSSWKVQRPNQTYAQVAIRGRSFDRIQGDQDINRPFVVSGKFEDAELVKVVEFLRSNPAMDASNSVQSFPILTLARQASDIVKVRTRGGPTKGQSITMRLDGQKWVLVSVSNWVA